MLHIFKKNITENYMHYIEVTISAILILMTLKGILLSVKSLRIARRTKLKFSNAVSHATTTQIVFFIPVLREQHQISEAIEYYSRLTKAYPFLRIIFITSDKERYERYYALRQVEVIYKLLKDNGKPENIIRRYPGLGPRALVEPILRKFFPDADALLSSLQELPTTRDCIDRELQGITHSRIGNIHYPYIKGLMAHQVNYGARYLFEVMNEGIDPQNTYIAIYNADSRPESHTIEEFLSAVSTDPGMVAAQQYTIYDVRDGSNEPPLGSALGQAAAIWQTRWSLSVEIPLASKAQRYKRNARPKRGFLSHLWIALSTPFSYVIGHGLYVRLAEFIQMNYLPETVHNEDQAYSYILALNDVKCYTLRSFDHSSVPSRPRQLFSQQAGWFRGTMMVHSYFHLAKNRKLIDNKGQIFAVVTAIKQFWYAIAWLLGPFIFLATFVWLLLGAGPFSALPFVSFMAYLLLPSIPAFIAVSNSRDQYYIRIWTTFTMLPVFYIIHGLAPLTMLMYWSFQYFTGNEYKKYKTDS